MSCSDSTIYSQLVNVFSQEWKSVIWILLTFPNACKKAQNYIDKEYAMFRSWCLGHRSQLSSNSKHKRIPVSLDWKSLVDDLVEEIPFRIGKDSLVSDHRFFLLPSNAQRDMILLISSNKNRINAHIFTDLGLFLVENFDRLNGWSKRLVYKTFFIQLKDQKPEGVLGNADAFLHHDNTINLNSKNSVYLTESAIKYLQELKVRVEINDMEDVYMADVQTKEKKREKLNNKDIIQGAQTVEQILESPKKMIKIDSHHISDDEEQKQTKSEHIVSVDIGCNKGDEKLDTSMTRTSTTISQGSVFPEKSFEELMSDYNNVGEMCHKLKEVFNVQLNQIGVVCTRLKLKNLNEDQLIFLMKCLATDNMHLNTVIVQKILNESFLQYLLNLDKATSRKILNCLTDAFRYLKKEVLNSVLIPLILHSREKSPQENIMLKLLNSNVLDKEDFVSLLNNLISEISETGIVKEPYGFLRCLEVILNKKPKLMLETISAFINILMQNKGKALSSSGTPKLVMLLIKQYKTEAISLSSNINLLLQNNTSLLKKSALKELNKVIGC